MFGEVFILSAIIELTILYGISRRQIGLRDPMSVVGLFGFGMKITFLFLRNGERVSLLRVSLTNLRSSGLNGIYIDLTS